MTSWGNNADSARWEHDQSPWNNSHTRQRDDESWNDPKRRKYNNGGHEPGGYDDPESLQRKRLTPSEPSPHVIFLGLEPDFTESDLQAFLSSKNCNIETVTIIRERSSGVSKGFGFAQFSSVENAVAFVAPLYPFISVPPPASHGATATASFYKAIESGATPSNGRRVKIDYSQSAAPHDRGGRPKQHANDGTRDIGSVQHAVLLFRGLDPLSGPQAICQAMLSSSGHGQQGAPGMKRIIVIKDKITLASFGFAFVEFVDANSASAVLAATMSPTIHESGFRISDRPVAASFAHPQSFSPVAAMLRDEAAIKSSIAMGGVDGTWVRYWDETSTVAVLEFEVEQPTPTPTVAVVKETKKKKSKNDPEYIAKTTIPAASVLPISSKPVTLSFSKLSQSKPAIGKALPSAALALSSGDDIDEIDTPPASVSHHTVAKVAPMIANKKVFNNINKWNQVQGELTNNSSNAIATLVDSEAAHAPVKQSAFTKPVTAIEQHGETDVSSTTASAEFADIVAKTCLLCARQFKSEEQLKRHNKESDLHKKNLLDINLCDSARRKALAATVSKDDSMPNNSGKDANHEPQKYRDRAAERRVIYQQPDNPELSNVDQSNRKKAAAKPAIPEPAVADPVVPPGQDESNVGNKLLKMMGWTQGTGLGSSGEGMVDPIQTAMYAQGAGLGASKGKDIGKLEGGYTGYLHQAQDSARERYGK